MQSGCWRRGLFAGAAYEGPRPPQRAGLEREVSAEDTPACDSGQLCTQACFCTADSVLTELQTGQEFK